MQSIQQMEQEFAKQVVTQIRGQDVTQGQLAKAFDRVSDKKHWKNPIDCTILINSEFDRLVIDRAITYFTGSVAHFESVNVITSSGKPTGQVRYRIRAAGYYLTIGA